MLAKCMLLHYRISEWAGLSQQSPHLDVSKLHEGFQLDAGGIAPVAAGVQDIANGQGRPEDAPQHAAALHLPAGCAHHTHCSPR